VKKTKIALPTNGEDLSTYISNSLERCLHFIIVDSDKQEAAKSFLNCAQIAARGAGIQIAQSLIDQQVEIVITPQIDSEALSYLQNAGIGIYLGIEGSLKENIEALSQKRLVEIKLTI
jgi:predicted Fe-Mo cluster-binding NifX family protein